MSNNSVNDELGLRLRHWLIKQTDKGLYGLEWVKNKTCIKLLWEKQHKHNWKMSYELFVVSNFFFLLLVLKSINLYYYCYST